MTAVRAWWQWVLTHHRRRASALLLLSGGAAMLQVILHAQSPAPTPLVPPAGTPTFTPLPTELAEWVSRNLFGLAVIGYHFVLSWNQFSANQKQTERNTQAISQLGADVAAIYVRKDVIEPQLTGIRDEIRNFRETFIKLTPHNGGAAS